MASRLLLLLQLCACLALRLPAPVPARAAPRCASPPRMLFGGGGDKEGGGGMGNMMETIKKAQQVGCRRGALRCAAQFRAPRRRLGRAPRLRAALAPPAAIPRSARARRRWV